MRDPMLDRMAEVLVRHSTRVRDGDLVTIVGDVGVLPAAESVFREVLRAGGHPSFHLKSERLAGLVFEHGSEAQIAHVSPFEAHRLEHCDVLVVLTCRDGSVPPPDPAKRARAQAARRGLLTRSLARGAAGEMRYVLGEIPGAAAAAEAGMSCEEYRAFIERACLLHLSDPAGAWGRRRDAQARAIEFLARARELRFRGEGEGGGTDLVVDVSGMTWVNCAGEENLPDGEVFTGPRSVEGVVGFNVPGWYQGSAVEGVRLRFRGGRVVEASAAKNEAFLLAMLDQDEGARVAGEVALGTNDQLTRITGNPFFDEKVGGTFHLALGAGYPQTGNTNSSGLHWDMVCDLRPGRHGAGGTVHADGVLIQKDGRFTMPGWPGATVDDGARRGG